jgi:hypothetical protein
MALQHPATAQSIEWRPTSVGTRRSAFVQPMRLNTSDYLASGVSIS